jgi:hypothetical protein
MRHKGIEFDVRVGITRETWTWVIHVPRPRRGEARSQISAMLRARRAIEQWCKANSVDRPRRDTGAAVPAP